MLGIGKAVSAGVKSIRSRAKAGKDLKDLIEDAGESVLGKIVKIGAGVAGVRSIANNVNGTLDEVDRFRDRFRSDEKDEEKEPEGDEEENKQDGDDEKQPEVDPEENNQDGSDDQTVAQAANSVANDPNPQESANQAAESNRKRRNQAIQTRVARRAKEIAQKRKKKARAKIMQLRMQWPLKASPEVKKVLADVHTQRKKVDGLTKKYNEVVRNGNPAVKKGWGEWLLQKPINFARYTRALGRTARAKINNNGDLLTYLRNHPDDIDLFKGLKQKTPEEEREHNKIIRTVEIEIEKAKLDAAQAKLKKAETKLAEAKAPLKALLHK